VSTLLLSAFCFYILNIAAIAAENNRLEPIGKRLAKALASFAVKTAHERDGVLSDFSDSLLWEFPGKLVFVPGKCISD
jgi:hypothetical protein